MAGRRRSRGGAPRDGTGVGRATVRTPSPSGSCAYRRSERSDAPLRSTALRLPIQRSRMFRARVPGSVPRPRRDTGSDRLRYRRQSPLLSQLAGGEGERARDPDRGGHDGEHAQRFRAPLLEWAAPRTSARNARLPGPPLTESKKPKKRESVPGPRIGHRVTHADHATGCGSVQAGPRHTASFRASAWRIAELR